MRSNQLEAWAEMAQAIAHEIKNPLTPIQLSTEHLERLLRDRGALPSRELEACLDNVIKQVQALREIASEFSTYAKLPSLTPEPTDPVKLMREALSPYVSAPPQGVTVEECFDPAPIVQVDRRVLSRAIVNLIENAVQAMPHGGTLTVGTSGGATAPAEAVLFVSDTGPGLAREVRARLFEPYFSTKSSGTGLGLAIVRRAVEAHGGRIDFESDPGTGTTFRIRIPAAKAAPTVYSTRVDKEQQQGS
jgi:nitrogen fixation/metabolism regulation signal transduction histidine kinase